MDNIWLYTGMRVFIANATTNRFYFDPYDGTDTNFWITDGTVPGTQLTSDLGQTGGLSEVVTAIAYGNGVVFSRYSDISAGTCATYYTVGVGGGNTLTLNSSLCASNMVVMNNIVYMLAKNSSTNDGVELWRSDGTVGGTFEVDSIAAGGTNGIMSTQLSVAPISSKLYFQANDGVTGQELWVSDGTAAGTHIVADLNPGSGSSAIGDIMEIGANVFFSVKTSGTGAELWKTNGTNATTSLVADLNPGAGDSWPANFLSVGASNLVFTAFDVNIPGTAFYTSDGTGAGTTELGTTATLPTAYANWKGAVLGAQTYLVGVPGFSEASLYQTDGTTTGTAKIVDIFPTANCANLPNVIAVVNTHMVMPFVEYGGGGDYAYTSDGTAGGTGLLNASVSFWHPVDNPAVNLGNGFSIFMGNGGGAGTDWEPWTTDGTAAGTSLLLETNPGASGSPTTFTRLGVLTLFFDTTAANGQELWVTDGTAANTQLVLDIYPGASSSIVFPFMTVFNGKVYFTATTDGADFYLWSSDGTAANTQMVSANVLAGSLEQGMYVFNGRLYFSGKTAATDPGYELYATDGTSAGTVLVKTINATSDALPENFATINGKLLFWATDGVNGTEPWISDGTTAGTQMLLAITSGGKNSATGDAPFVVQNMLYFSALANNGDVQLWQTDGTAANTSMLADLTAQDAQASQIEFIDDVNGKIYFESQGDFTTWTLNPASLVVSNISGPSQILNFVVENNGKLYFTDGYGNLFCTQ